MEFAALIRFSFTTLALVLCCAGCASQTAAPSDEEVKAFQGQPIPESVKEKMRASPTAVPVTTATPAQ